MTFMNQAMVDSQLNTSAENPIIAVQINHEKNFAFVEVHFLFLIGRD